MWLWTSTTATNTFLMMKVLIRQCRGRGICWILRVRSAWRWRPTVVGQVRSSSTTSRRMETVPQCRGKYCVCKCWEGVGGSGPPTGRTIPEEIPVGKEEAGKENGTIRGRRLGRPSSNIRRVELTDKNADRSGLDVSKEAVGDWEFGKFYKEDDEQWLRSLEAPSTVPTCLPTWLYNAQT